VNIQGLSNTNYATGIEQKNSTKLDGSSPFPMGKRDFARSQRRSQLINFSLAA
jgi:hypothetical protein